VPRAIWTVLVDRIDNTSAFHSMSIDKDIKFSGHVTWAGKTSMEVGIRLSQEDSAGVERKLLGRCYNGGGALSEISWVFQY